VGAIHLGFEVVTRAYGLPEGDDAGAVARVVGILEEEKGRGVVNSAVAAARELLGMEMSFVSEFSSDEQIYRFVAGDGESFGLSEGAVADQDHGFCKWMLSGALPNVVPDVRSDVRTKDVVAAVAADVGAYVGVPVRLSDGRVYGSFCCVSHGSCPELGERDRTIMRLLARLVAEELERELAARERRRLEIEANASQALVAALQAREGYTAEHSRSVLHLALALGRHLGLDQRELTEVGQVALLHDIGKVGVPDAVLQKGGRLDGLELEAMREHPAIGERIIGAIDGLTHLRAAVRAEHERWDGTGYPDGLAGEEIPLASRICLVCDAYDAMTSDRPYRPALAHRGAVEELRRGAGTQFDPELVEAVLEVLRERRPGERYAEMAIADAIER
jgi:response regulator RpfG family c-di-GMP phosphodiesterase